MAKLIGAFTLGIALVVGCANQQAAPEPQTGPPGVDIEYHDRSDEAEAEPKSSNANEESKDEAKERETTKDDESSPPKDEAESKPAPAKKSCNGLKKSQCEVSMGCAWSSDKKCVNQ